MMLMVVMLIIVLMITMQMLMLMLVLIIVMEGHTAQVCLQHQPLQPLPTQRSGRPTSRS